VDIIHTTNFVVANYIHTIAVREEFFHINCTRTRKKILCQGSVCMWWVSAGSVLLCVWMEGCACYAAGVQEEPNGDCEEANGAYGQSWRHNIQRWVAFKNYSDLFPEQLPIYHKLWMVSINPLSGGLTWCWWHLNVYWIVLLQLHLIQGVKWLRMTELWVYKDAGRMC